MGNLSSNSIEQRVTALQDWLKENQFDLIIIPHEDEFLNEYLPLHNERLEWITGFSGSAGCAIITQSQAVIFTDGRYTLQVKQQVPDFFIFKHLVDNPPVEWIKETIILGDTPLKRIALDPRFHSYRWYQTQISELSPHQICTVTTPIDILWNDRPQPEQTMAQLMDNAIAGESAFSKRLEISQLLQKSNANGLLVTQLDSLCWLMNMRGTDIPHTPVIFATAILHDTGAIDLFIDQSRLPADAWAHFEAEHKTAGVHLFAPHQLEEQLTTFANRSMMVDYSKINANLILTLQNSDVIVIEKEDPIQLLKACKNSVEIEGMKQAHLLDAVAMVRFLTWLDTHADKYSLSEAMLADKLEAFRRLEPTLVDLSFSSISAAGKNAALCHYNHMNQPQSTYLEKDSLYLIDSGGQYLNGTTDITRTIGIGENIDPHMKKMFTLVLKGHIALNQSRFPNGTIGMQLDSFARQYLWQEGYDFDHGTGHGVGHFLSVHEGPQNISKRPVHVALKEGMVVSNEPGYYYSPDSNGAFAKGFGIRIENLEHITSENMPSGFLGFEALTYVPIDKNLILLEILTPNEIKWLNVYHQKVWDKISPLLKDDKDKEWLAQATRAL